MPLWLGECGAGAINDAVFYDICAHYGTYTPWGWKTARSDRPDHGGRIIPCPRIGRISRTFQMVGPRPILYEESPSRS